MKIHCTVGLIGLLCLRGLTLAQNPVVVVNYTGYNPYAPLAPGSIASAYGNFGAVTTAGWDAGQPPMPRELSGVRVRVGGIDCPLYYVSSSQINFNIPVNTTTGVHTVEVVSGGTVVARGQVRVYPYFPALAARGENRLGIILNQDYSDNFTTPAARGSVIVLFATGCGATTPPAQDGVPSGAEAPTVARVRAFVSVDEAPVIYAGAQPTYPGLCQINVRLPDRPYITGLVPLFITVDGVASNPVHVRVQ
jgi:uncharacterized protein (TIGR03437 family)